MRRPLLALVLLSTAFACGGREAVAVPSSVPPPTTAAPRPEPAPSTPARREPVVVAIVVDQLSAWVADSRLPKLPDANGGFGRLVREGTWAKRLTYPYAVTDTAPGHAALHTGKLPSESGLFANELPDPSGTGRISILRDASTRVVTSAGVKDAAGSSAARLKVDTVADRLRAARPDALVVSFSLKDRGAIVPAGKHPSHVLWFDTGEIAFVTSTAFEKEWPSWAKGVGDRGAITKRMATPWTPLDAEWLAKNAGTKDDAPGEGDIEKTFGTTFPHVAKDGPSFRALPASDEAIASLALSAIDAEWDPAKPTLVLLSFSANDVVGHVFGPDSWEAWDLLRRLDGTLGRFIDTLEKKVGPVSVVLSADHGDVPMPEATTARAEQCADCKTDERVSPQALTVELRRAAAKAVPGVDPKSLVAGVADPYVFLTPEARALDAKRASALDRALRDALVKHKGIAQIFDAKTLLDKCPAALAKNGDDELTLVCRGWPRGMPAETGAGDYYLLAARGSFFDAEITTGKGTSHGTPYAYDRTVPLFVRTADKANAGATIDGAIDFTAYSEIEASLLGLDARAPKEILAAKRR